MKKIIGLVALMSLVATGCCCLCKNDGAAAKAVSPDGRNEIRLWIEPLSYAVVRDGKTVVAKTEIGIKVNGGCVAKSALRGVSKRELSGTVKAQNYKKAEVNLAANETVADFGDWELRLAARNDGVAYRFVVKGEGAKVIDCEKANLTIPAQARCAFNRTGASGQEETVSEYADAAKLPVDAKKLIYLPFVYSVDGVTVAVTEADLHEYPIWNLRHTEAAAEGAATVSLVSKFDQHPDKIYYFQLEDWGKPGRRIEKGGRFVRVDSTHDYLVKSEGGRALPWRVFVLADQPAKLIDADIVWALATPANGDYSWVKPGKVAWDWWNAWDNLGEADGCNTAMYKRFIDFAARTGVEYVILDEGWSETLNIWKFHPNVDVPEIIRYGKEKGVGIVLWMAWAQIYGEEAKVAEHFGNLGAAGFKVDFMDRGDAQCAAFKEKFAQECAKRKLLIDYHGAFRPTGLSRTYPNILNFEGIHGLECMKFYRQEDMMANDVSAAFLRMTAGPLDYTPGAMDNYPVGAYKGNGRNPGSMGTRCRQMAMMAIYEAPLQMLSDSPTKYEKNMECFSFMAAMPVVWDDSIGIGGCPESFVALARRKGAAWYAAGMTNSKARDYTLDTAFLGGGKWNAEIFRDTEKGATEPTTYLHEKREISAGDKIALPMAPGGGFVLKFTK